MENNTNFYLSKGFSSKTAEYFASGRKQILSATPNKDFTLTLTFDSGEIRLYDMKPLIRSQTVFSFLEDYQCFSQVYLDEYHAVSWKRPLSGPDDPGPSSKIDLCPDQCYTDSIPFPSNTP